MRLKLFLIISPYLLSFIQFYIAFWNKGPSNACFLIPSSKNFWAQDCFWHDWNIYWPEVLGLNGLSVHALSHHKSGKEKPCTYPVLNLTFHPCTGIPYKAQEKGFTNYLCIFDVKLWRLNASLLMIFFNVYKNIPLVLFMCPKSVSCNFFLLL